MEGIFSFFENTILNLYPSESVQLAHFQEDNIVYNIILYHTTPLSPITYNTDDYNSDIYKSEDEDKDMLLIEELL